MARIPTINAQDITPPPGTGGGVLLGNVGISNIQVKTPLTEQMNPAAFGQEGAAIVKGASDIFNNAVIPRMRIQSANKRFTEYADTTSAVNREIDTMNMDIQTGNIEVDQYNRPRNIMKEIQTSTGNWLQQIETNISDPRYRGAAKISIAQKIATMTLAANNKLADLSNKSAEASYLKNSYGFHERFKLPTRQNTVHGPVTTLPNWDIALGELDTLDNTLENTLMNDLKKLELRDKGHLRIFNSIVEKLKLTDPKLGMQFMETDQVAKLLDGVSTGEEAKAKAVAAFKSTIKAQIEFENKEDELEHTRHERASAELVDDNYNDLYKKISLGQDTRMNTVWLVNTWKKHFMNANRKDDFKTLYDLAAKYSYQVGDTDLAELYKFQTQAIAGELDIPELIASTRLKREDVLTLSKFYQTRQGEGDWLFKDPKFTLAKKAFEKSISIPAGSADTNARQMGTVALGLMIEKVTQSLEKGQQWSKKNDDWDTYFQDLMNQYGSLHSDYGARHTQLYLGNLNSRLPREMQNNRFAGAGDKIVYDWQRDEVQAHQLAIAGKLQGEKLREIYNVIDQMKHIITPSQLNGLKTQQGVQPGERGQLASRIATGEAPKTYFKFTKPPANIQERIPAVSQPKKQKPKVTTQPEELPAISPVPGKDPLQKYLRPEEAPQDTSENYNNELAAELSELYPLTMPKPAGPPMEGEPTTVLNEGAFNAWVWHPELNDWKIHGSSLDPRTGEVLKRPGHPTWDLMIQEEEKLGNKIIEKDGKFYSVKKDGSPSTGPGSEDDQPDVLDLTAKTDEDVNEIRNIIIDLAEGKMISSLRDYDGSNITNIGIAREIWQTVSDDVQQNPSDEELKKLFDQYKIPYKR